MTINDFSLALSVKLDKDFTREQRDFFENFTVPTLAFASPGTGKTMAAVAGLLTTELFHGIPGENIYAMSFTRAATGELAIRHKRACEKLSSGVGSSRVVQTIQFGTLSAFCKSIVEENFEALGMSEKPATQQIPMASATTIIRELCSTWNIPVAQNRIRTVVNTIRTLNASLMFDRVNVENSYEFKCTGLSYDEFTRLREAMFVYAVNMNIMPVNDIFLYALTVFLRKPEVSAELKKKIRVMLVDEAQDLSLLQLKLISYMTACPVLIGDMKQQIYGFNGACAEIVDEFFKLYPNARRMELTQSFRCSNQIAAFATRIILPNRMGGETFKGVADGCDVQVLDTINHATIAAMLKEDYDIHHSNFSKDFMFLFRNNVSMVPIIEALYQAKVPYRSDKYIAVSKLPVIRELLSIVALSRNPFDLNNLLALKYLLPEFRVYRDSTAMPVYKLLSKIGGSLYDLNYQYKDSNAPVVFNCLMQVTDMLKRGCQLSDVLNRIYPLFRDAWLEDNEWKLEQPASYYTNIAGAAISGKTFDEFVYDEVRKEEINTEYMAMNRGVRCYTMHASKGLEADVVYIIDADADILPSTSQIERKSKFKCDLAISKDIRNERSLCYVACTRAREELYIVSRSEVSPMVLGDNRYENYDMLYKCMSTVAYDEIGAFTEFIGGAIGAAV